MQDFGFLGPSLFEAYLDAGKRSEPPRGSTRRILSPFFALLQALAWSRKTSQISSIYRGFNDMSCCIGSHQIAPNSGTNRHQNRHQSYAHFSQSRPSDFRSCSGDFTMRTDPRTQRILALSATRNRHQDFSKPLSSLHGTDMQPAPPLLRVFYPTYGDLKRSSAVLENRPVRLVWVLSLRAILDGDLHQRHWIAILETAAVFDKAVFPHSRHHKAF